MRRGCPLRRGRRRDAAVRPPARGVGRLVALHQGGAHFELLGDARRLQLREDVLVDARLADEQLRGGGGAAAGGSGGRWRRAAVAAAAGEPQTQATAPPQPPSPPRLFVGPPGSLRAGPLPWPTPAASSRPAPPPRPGRSQSCCHTPTPEGARGKACRTHTCRFGSGCVSHPVAPHAAHGAAKGAGRLAARPPAPPGACSCRRPPASRRPRTPPG